MVLTLDAVAGIPNLRQAWTGVRQGGVTPGIDRLTPEQFGVGLDARLVDLHGRLIGGIYRPKPARRLRIESDPSRPLTVPTVEDRVVQRAIAILLGPALDRTFSARSHAYRPRRSVETAAADVERALRDGRVHFVRTDIESFFDTLDRARLRQSVGEFVTDARLLRLIDRVVAARVLEGEAIHLPQRGVAQGSALSPLLSNLYLDPFDHEVADAGFMHVRYADDILVLARTADEAGAALAAMAKTATALRLRLSGRKTVIGHLAQGFDFLGIRFGSGGRGPSVRALAALTARTTALATLQPGRIEALADSVACFEGFYGDLDPGQISSLAILAGKLACLHGHAPSVAGLEVVVRELEERCAALRAEPDEPPWLALARLLLWRGLGSQRGLLAEAVRLAPRAGSDAAISAALSETLDVRREHLGPLLDGLGEDDPFLVAQALARAGLPALAKVARGMALLAGGRTARASGPSAAGARDQAKALLPLFAGHPSRHARERLNGRGQLVLDRVDGPIDAAALEAHLRGSRQVAIYPLLPGGRTQMAVIRVGIKRDAVGRREDLLRDGRGGPRAAEEAAREFARTLCRSAKRLGAVPLLEAAPRGSFRLWFRLASPAPVQAVRALLVRIEAAAGPASPALAVWLFPGTDQLAKPGPAQVLPLGTDPRTGERSRFVTDQPEPETVDPPGALSIWPAIGDKALVTLTTTGPFAGGDTAVVRQRPAELLKGLPRALRMVESCHLLGALAEKARDVGFLEYVEVLALVNTLGHLPDTEGRQALARILEPVGMQERKLAELLRRLPPNPTSCGRLKQQLLRLAIRYGCQCPFRSLPKYAYPSPVLLAVRVRDVAAFESRRYGAPGAVKPVPSPPAEGVVTVPPEPVPDVPSEVAEPPRTRRSRRRGTGSSRRDPSGAGIEPACELEPEIRPSVSPDPGPPPTIPSIEDLVAVYARLCLDLDDLARKGSQVESEIIAWLDSVGTWKADVGAWTVERIEGAHGLGRIRASLTARDTRGGLDRLRSAALADGPGIQASEMAIGGHERSPDAGERGAD